MNNAFAGKEVLPLVCSLYVSSCARTQESPRSLAWTDLAAALRELPTVGRWEITETPNGLVVSFSSEQDSERFQELDLATVFNGPVQIARFATGDASFRQVALVRDVPWTVAQRDLQMALQNQNISGTIIGRGRNQLRVEIQNPSDYERLLREGLNFFGVTWFAVTPDRQPSKFHDQKDSGSNGSSEATDVLQCFRCQGFWHVAANCRQLPRCVRCGEPHAVEYCPRPRNNPVCCHCGGPHHAAYKQCPLRLELATATPVTFSLSIDRKGTSSTASINSKRKSTS